jgi:coenzyme F420 hydrogenase subunit beta
LAYNREDILYSQQSKYIPIPLLTALSIVKENNERFALVGLSCHIHGLYNVLDTKPSLKKKFKFSIGLVCDRVMVNAGMDYLIDKAGANKNEVTAFYFRDKKPYGYPGHVHIKTSEKSYVLSPQERMSIKDFFTPARCRICFDKMNIGADITIGDPHGIEGVDRYKGESLVISRTEKGEEILKCIENIEFRVADYKSALMGQSIGTKKEDWGGYTDQWSKLDKPVPSYYAYISRFRYNKKNKKYAKSLDQALSLTSTKQRQDLISQYTKQIKKEKLKRKILFPAIFAKRVLTKIKKELSS